MMPVLSRQFVLALLIPRLLPYALIAEPWVCVIAAVRSGVVITSVLHTVQLHVVQEVWDALQLEDDGSFLRLLMAVRSMFSWQFLRLQFMGKWLLGLSSFWAPFSTSLCLFWWILAALPRLSVPSWLLGFLV
jgi:hypothetical protein